MMDSTLDEAGAENKGDIAAPSDTVCALAAGKSFAEPPRRTCQIFQMWSNHGLRRPTKVSRAELLQYGRKLTPW